MRNSAFPFLMMLLSLTTTQQTARGENSGELPLRSDQDSSKWAAELSAGPTSGLEDVIFAVRSVIPEHWYANFGYFSPDSSQKCYGKGGRLCKLNLKTGKLTALVDDPEGRSVIRASTTMASGSSSISGP